MNARRALLVAAVAVIPVLHIHSAEQLQSLTGSYPHPDADLLALCGRLEEMQAEWQRLYDATSDDNSGTPADKAFEAYSDDVWPRTALQPLGNTAIDWPGKLVDLHATTPHGLRAKAMAVIALDEAAGYLSECRDDSLELAMSLIRDVAGSAARPLGADHTPLRPVPLTT
jgi:hypothetical protein